MHAKSAAIESDPSSFLSSLVCSRTNGVMRMIRVPLDIQRTGRRTLGWRPLMMSQFRVSCGGSQAHVIFFSVVRNYEGANQYHINNQHVIVFTKDVVMSIKLLLH